MKYSRLEGLSGALVEHHAWALEMTQGLQVMDYVILVKRRYGTWRISKEHKNSGWKAISEKILLGIERGKKDSTTKHRR